MSKRPNHQQQSALQQLLSTMPPEIYVFPVQSIARSSIFVLTVALAVDQEVPLIQPAIFAQTMKGFQQLWKER